MVGFYYASYGLVIIGALISIIASWNVKRTYKKYSSYGNSRGIRAEQVAQKILGSARIYDVRIERVSGSLTDHYSPREKVLRLSDRVYGSTSVAAIGVAAHECGHAIQYARGYFPLSLRSAVIPIVNRLNIIVAGYIAWIDFWMDRSGRYRDYPVFAGCNFSIYYSSGRV